MGAFMTLRQISVGLYILLGCELYITAGNFVYREECENKVASAGEPLALQS